MFNTITYVQAAVLLIGCIVSFRLLRALFDPLRSIPGPFAARFTRSWYYRQLSSGKSRWTEVDLHRKYGPVIRLAPNQYSIDNLEVAKQLYGPQTKFIKSDWYKPWSSNLVNPHGFDDVFSIQNPYHHHDQRKVINNLYSMSNLVQMETCIDETTSLLFKAFDRFSKRDEVFDLHHWMRCYALDVIMYITLNKRFGLLEDGNDEGLLKPFGEHTMFCTLAGIYPDFFCALIRILVKLPIKQPLQRILVFVNQELNEFEAKFKTKHEVEDGNLDEKSIIYRGTTFYHRDPNKFPKQALETVSMMNVFAGTDTTGIALTAIIYYLTMFPKTLAKLRTEIHETKAKLDNGDKSLTYQQAQKMPYLQAVVKEAMRLHSPVGMSLPRVVPQGGATLAGVHFPAGTEVGVNAWVAHRNTEVYGSDAEEFRPERWLLGGENSAERIHDMEAYLLTFGQGSRICLGKNISMLGISKVVPEIVTRFDFDFTEEAVKKDITRGIDSAGGWFVQQNNMQCKVKRIEAKA